MNFYKLQIIIIIVRSAVILLILLTKEKKNKSLSQIIFERVLNAFIGFCKKKVLLRSFHIIVKYIFSFFEIVFVRGSYLSRSVVFDACIYDSDKYSN